MNTTPIPTPTLAERLILLVEGFCAAIGLRVGRGQEVNLLLAEAWMQVRRRGVHLARLMERFRAGTLPKRRARAVRAGVREKKASPRKREKKASPRKPGRMRLPAKLLLRQVLDTHHYRLQLEQMMGEAEMAALVAASPRAAQTLRALCRLLEVETLPDYLALPPPRPRKPRPKRPRKPREKRMRLEDYSPQGWRPPYRKPRRRREA